MVSIITTEMKTVREGSNASEFIFILYLLDILDLLPQLLHTFNPYSFLTSPLVVYRELKYYTNIRRCCVILILPYKEVTSQSLTCTQHRTNPRNSCMAASSYRSMQKFAAPKLMRKILNSRAVVLLLTPSRHSPSSSSDVHDLRAHV